jgi:hypothetical protein
MSADPLSELLGTISGKKRKLFGGYRCRHLRAVSGFTPISAAIVSGDGQIPTISRKLCMAPL